MERLNQFTLDIEFLIISVIQAVVLGALGLEAGELLGHFDPVHWLYVAGSFLLILNFWSQAIIHAISFVDWPLDLPHNLLYFLASFIEVLIFFRLEDPQGWFLLTAAFFAVGGILYLADLRLIRQRKGRFTDSPARVRLYQDIEGQQVSELRIFVPIAVAFHLVAFGAIYLNPQLFIDGHWHVALIVLQIAAGLGFLIRSLHNFDRRSVLITDSLNTGVATGS